MRTRVPSSPPSGERTRIPSSPPSGERRPYADEWLADSRTHPQDTTTPPPSPPGSSSSVSVSGGAGGLEEDEDIETLVLSPRSSELLKALGGDGSEGSPNSPSRLGSFRLAGRTVSSASVLSPTQRPITAPAKPSAALERERSFQASCHPVQQRISALRVPPTTKPRKMSIPGAAELRAATSQYKLKHQASVRLRLEGRLGKGLMTAESPRPEEFLRHGSSGSLGRRVAGCR